MTRESKVRRRRLQTRRQLPRRHRSTRPRRLLPPRRRLHPLRPTHPPLLPQRTRQLLRLPTRLLTATPSTPPAALPARPARPTVPWCAGASLVCFASQPGPGGPDAPPVCQPFPTDCGETGGRCCLASYHNPTDRQLSPRCKNGNDYCGGPWDAGVCTANAADCRTQGAECCIGPSELATVCTCKEGLGLVLLAAKTCGACPTSQVPEPLGSSMCTES